MYCKHPCLSRAYVLWNSVIGSGRSYVPIDVLENMVGCSVAAVVDVRRCKVITTVPKVICYLGEGSVYTENNVGGA